MTSKFVEMVLPSHRQGNCIPFAAIRCHELVIGPRLEGHSVIFLAIQTHHSCRFLISVDSLGLRRSETSSQFIDPPQDFPKQVPGHGDFGQLERDVPAMAANFGPISTSFSRSVQRPMLRFLRYG